jgi:hypothetical protein
MTASAIWPGTSRSLWPYPRTRLHQKIPSRNHSPPSTASTPAAIAVPARGRGGATAAIHQLRDEYAPWPDSTGTTDVR